MLNYLFENSHDINFVKKYYHCLLIPFVRDVLSNNSWEKELSESNPLLTKFVIKHWKKYDMELRFHFYDKKNQEPNIHDHRWSFYSLILSGSIKEIKYEKRDNQFNALDENTYIAGDVYFVKNTDYHTALPSKDLVTLILRGPGVKSSWRQYDLKGEFIKEYPLHVFNPHEKQLSDSDSSFYVKSAENLLSQTFK